MSSPYSNVSGALTDKGGKGGGDTARAVPAFIIVGVPGSGTSSLAECLNRQSQIAIAPSISWITKYFETRSGLDAHGVIAGELVLKWVQQQRFREFSLPADALRTLLPCGERLPWKDFVGRLLLLYGQHCNKAVVGSRSAGCSRHLRTLHQAWPGTKFIHLVRDGRNVYLTLRDRHDGDRSTYQVETWDQDPATTAALLWKYELQGAFDARAALGPAAYYELRYESMVTDPHGQLARLLDFLEVPYHAHELELDVRELFSGTADWSTGLSRVEIENFEAAAGERLEELRYPCLYTQLAPRALEQYWCIRERFLQFLCPARATHEELQRWRSHKDWFNPFVFIVGCPRSGTTLVQRILDEHSRLTVSPETFWIPYYFNRRLGVTADGLVTPDLVPELLQYYKFYRMKVDREELTTWLQERQAPTYAEFVAHVFDLYGEFRGKALVGDKTPDYCRSMDVLHRLWPAAKFVHVIRDGRDVALSALGWKRKAGRLASLYSTWTKAPAATAAAWWAWHVGLGRKSGGTLGPELYHEIRYEALVAAPAQECARLCEFLGITFEESMLHFHQGRTQEGVDAKSAWLPITPGLRDWRTQMPDEDVERFEATAGELLQELGYVRAIERPRPAIAMEAAHMKSVFAQDVSALGEWLP